jgi:hypothetical protein
MTKETKMTHEQIFAFQMEELQKTLNEVLNQIKVLMENAKVPGVISDDCTCWCHHGAGVCACDCGHRVAG